MLFNACKYNISLNLCFAFGKEKNILWFMQVICVNQSIQVKLVKQPYKINILSAEFVPNTTWLQQFN